MDAVWGLDATDLLLPVCLISCFLCSRSQARSFSSNVPAAATPAFLQTVRLQTSSQMVVTRSEKTERDVSLGGFERCDIKPATSRLEEAIIQKSLHQSNVLWWLSTLITDGELQKVTPTLRYVHSNTSRPRRHHQDISKAKTKHIISTSSSQVKHISQAFR